MKTKRTRSYAVQPGDQDTAFDAAREMALELLVLISTVTFTP